MSINLAKGRGLDLEKRYANVRVGLAWDANALGGAPFDADVSVAVLKGDEVRKLVADEWFVFYNNKASPADAVTHGGDNRTGRGDGDDETVTIRLGSLPPETTEVAIVASIHDGEERRQDWSALKAACTLYDADAGTVLARYDLGRDFAGKVSVQVASFYRTEAGRWTFKALGAGYAHGLGPFVESWQ